MPACRSVIVIMHTLLVLGLQSLPAADIPALTGRSGLNLASPDGYYTVPYNNTNAPLRTLLVFTDFSNVTGIANPWQPAYYAERLFEISGDNNGVIDHFSQQSYGNHTVTVDIDYAWIRMPEPYVQNVYPQSGRPTNYIHDALLAAQAAGHEMINYDLVYLAMPLGVSPNSPTHYFGDGELAGVNNAPRVVITFGDDAQNDYWTRKQLVMHETGHAMGMPDLYMYSGWDLPQNQDVMGPWDIMGNNWEALGYCGWTRHYWGWLEASRKAWVPSGSQTISLAPLDGSTGTSLIVLPGANFPDDVIVIENPTPFKPSVANGVLIYTIDSTVAGGSGPMRIVFPNGVSSAYADNVLWQPGSSYTDPATGSLIEILNTAGDDFIVRVRAGPQINRQVGLLVAPAPANLFIENSGNLNAHTGTGASIGPLDAAVDHAFNFVIGASQ